MLNILNEFLASKEGKDLLEKLKIAYEKDTVYPAYDDLFRAFYLCQKPKVVIIGQDPYHDGSADGLAFSSRIKMPPSLRNIFKEILNNFNNPQPLLNHDLSYLAKEGVLLLNASLSVIAKRPNSHRHLWQNFFIHTLKRLNANYENLVFMLWGNFAQNCEIYIDKDRHLILKAAHPSPLARGKFFGNEHFKKCNIYLKNHQKSPINWL